VAAKARPSPLDTLDDQHWRLIRLVAWLQYHLPRAKPPNAISPMSVTINSIQKLQKTIRTIPRITMIPQSEIHHTCGQPMPASPSI
jgi:hypothetical protein